MFFWSVEGNRSTEREPAQTSVELLVPGQCAPCRPSFAHMNESSAELLFCVGIPFGGGVSSDCQCVQPYRSDCPAVSFSEQSQRLRGDNCSQVSVLIRKPNRVLDVRGLERSINQVFLVGLENVSLYTRLRVSEFRRQQRDHQWLLWLFFNPHMLLLTSKPHRPF